MKTSIHIPLTLLALTSFTQFTAAHAGNGGPPQFDGKGLYFGLADGTTFENSGCVSVVISKKGAVTVGLKVGAEKTSVTGTVDPVTKQFVVQAGSLNPHSVAFALVSNPNEVPRVDGTLTVDAATISFSAPILERDPVGLNVPEKGKFTAVLSGVIGTVALDTTAGIAKLRVLPHGKLKVDPTMADGRPQPFVTQIAADGSARFWRPIGKTGALTGTLQFTNDPLATADVTGSVDWFKPAREDGRYYPEAFNAALTLEGSRYENVAPILDFSASAGVGILTVDLAEYTASVVVEGTLDSHNKFTIAGDGSVKLGFNQGVGLARGVAVQSPTASGALRGVVLQKQNVAQGMVFGASATGEFQLEVKP